MRTALKKTSLAVLALAGLLAAAPAAFAHHRALDRSLEDYGDRYGYDQYGYGHPDYDADDSYDQYGSYDELPDYDEDDSYDRYGSYEDRPYYGDRYGSGSGPYDDESDYPGSSAPNPLSTLPSLLDLPLDILLPR